jgi:hypothetical protein
MDQVNKTAIKKKVASVAGHAEDGMGILKKMVYWGLFGLLYLLYGITFFHIIYINPMWIRLLSTAIQTLVCLFLLVRFNPFRKHELREFDGQIIFASAFILLTNLVSTEFSLRSGEDVYAKFVDIFSKKSAI